MNHPVSLLQPFINYSYPTTSTRYYSLQRSRSSSRSYYKHDPRLLLLPRFKSSSPIRSNSIDESTTTSTADVLKSDYKPGIFDQLFLTLFRNKMVEEVGWDSDEPGYQGLIEAVNRLMMKNQNNSETEKAAVRILISLFPPLLLELYKMLVAPLGKGQVVAVMVDWRELQRAKDLCQTQPIEVELNGCIDRAFVLAKRQEREGGREETRESESERDEETQ